MFWLSFPFWDFFSSPNQKTKDFLPLAPMSRANGKKGSFPREKSVFYNEVHSRIESSGTLGIKKLFITLVK